MRPSHYRTRPKVELTPRQRQVLELVAHGKTNPEIADTLGITLDGAKFHVSEILDRLGVSTREEAATWWRATHGIRASVRRTAGFVVGSLLVRVAAGGAALLLAAIAVVIATGSLPGGGAQPVASASPTSSNQGRNHIASATPALSGAADPIATATTAVVASTAATAAVLQPCTASGLVARLRGQGATEMLFFGMTVDAPEPCQLDGILRVTAVAANGPLSGSPMTIPVDAPIDGEAGIPLAAIIPMVCTPPSTVISVALNGSALTSWKLSRYADASCTPDAGMPVKLIVGPQERGPGGALMVDPIQSPQDTCDLTHAVLSVQERALYDDHGGEGVTAGLTGFATPCHLAAVSTIALVDASGQPLAVTGNPSRFDIVADPNSLTDPSAGASLGWDNWCGSSQVYVRLTINGHDFTAPVTTLPACNDRAAASTLTVEPPL